MGTIRSAMFWVLWLFAASAWSAKYHVDAESGDDTRSGLSDQAGEAGPWQSLERVQRARLKKGDIVLFKRGGRWLGPLVLQSGVTYGAYGSGALPVISGAIDLKWPVGSPGAGSVHVMPLNLKGQVPTQLFIQETSGRVLKLTRARHPNVGQGAFGPGSRYLAVAKDQASDRADELRVDPGVLPPQADMAQAFAFVRNDRWVMSAYNVEGVRQDRLLRIRPVEREVLAVRPGWGYWLENERWMLDAPGEWVYDQRRQQLHVWLPEGMTARSGTLRLSVVPHAVVGRDASRFTLKDIEVQDTASDGVSIHGAQDAFRIDRVVVTRAGRQGLYITGSEGGTLNQVQVLDSVAEGISLGDFRFTPHVQPSRGMEVTDCLVRNAGVAYYAHSAVVLGDGGTLQGCRIENTAFIGIHAWKSNLIQGNHVSGACLSFDDCGAIYTISRHGGRRGYPLDVRIEGNLITAAPAGLPASDASRRDGVPGAAWRSETRGIYLDDDSRDVRVQGNTVSGHDQGLLLHLATRNLIQSNVIHGNRDIQLWFQQNDAAHPVRANQVVNNTLLGHVGSLLMVLSNDFGDVQDFARFTGNRYLAPGTAQPIHLARGLRSTPLGLEAWQQFSGEEGGHFQRRATTRSSSVSKGVRLVDGHFDQGLAGWQSWGLRATPQGTGCALGACLRLMPEGTQRSDRGVPYGFINTAKLIPIKQGVKYLVSFQAKASGDAQAEVLMRSPAHNYGKVSTQQALTLSPTWQRHEVLIEATQSVLAGARLDVVVASNSEVWVDEVTMQALGEGLSDASGGVHVLTNATDKSQEQACPAPTPTACQALVDTTTMKRVVFPLTLGPRQGRVLSSDLLVTP